MPRVDEPEQNIDTTSTSIEDAARAYLITPGLDWVSAWASVPAMPTFYPAPGPSVGGYPQEYHPMVDAADHWDFGLWWSHEVNRLRLGQAPYGAPVWHAEDWWGLRVFSPIWEFRHHLPRIDPTAPDMISFYNKVQDARVGSLTRMRPGRYLRTFFGDILGESRIKLYTEQQASGYAKTPWRDLELQFAWDRGSCASAYRDGPSSCMSDPLSRYGVHPAEAYAAGDLAIAYLRQPEHMQAAYGGPPVLARALCWPAKKVYSRIYPTVENANRDGFFSGRDSALARAILREKLPADWSNCYQSGSKQEDNKALDGARLLKIKLPVHSSNYLLMPYLDGGFSVSAHAKDNRFWALRPPTRGHYGGASTLGVIGVPETEIPAELPDFLLGQARDLRRPAGIPELSEPQVPDWIQPQSPLTIE